RLGPGQRRGMSAAMGPASRSCPHRLGLPSGRRVRDDRGAMRLLRVTLLTTLGLCVAELAHTGPPDPVHSTLSGAFIDLAGTTPSGAPDVCGDTGCPDYNLTFRNFANIPIAGATIVIDFSGCPDIQLSSDQVGRYPTQTVVCPSQIQGTTDADGKFTFSIE